MNMKKQNIALAALAAFASLGTPQTLPAQNAASQTQRHNEGLNKQIQPAKVETLPELMPGGGRQYVGKSGLTPKQYGQWLQSTGRQKWIKKTK
jgi:hypothetical protein